MNLEILSSFLLKWKDKKIKCALFEITIKNYIIKQRDEKLKNKNG